MFFGLYHLIGKEILVFSLNAQNEFVVFPNKIIIKLYVILYKNSTCLD